MLTWSIISLILYFEGQILIATGDPAKNGQEIELIDLVNPDFKCQHFKKLIPPRFEFHFWMNDTFFQS